MIICTICARGGSKGLPGKNTRLLLGEPLLCWTLNQARLSHVFDIIVVSSDSDEVLEVVREYTRLWPFDAVLLKRPAELATDKSSKLPAIVHAVTTVEDAIGRNFKTIVDMDVTSPLRLPSDIVEVVRLLEESGCTNVISVTPSHRNPSFNLAKVQDGFLSLYTPSRIVRRQDAPITYDLNASIYCWDAKKFLDDPKLFYPDTKAYIMPKERSIDIDDEIDFAFVELLMKRRCLN